MTVLSQVLQSLESKTIPDSLLRAQTRIANERRKVERYLETPHRAPVYGFDTLFGPLSNRSASTEDQHSLLHGHLLGHRVSITNTHHRLISLVKLHVLSLGGSGVSPETYTYLIDHLWDDHDLSGAWWDSYGSGDVVPGAWWVKSFYGTATPPLARGDLICLINGNFISTAAAIEVLQTSVNVFGAIAAAALASGGLSALTNIPRWARPYQDANGTSPSVGTPVSSRDVAPLLESIETALRNSASAVNFRLTRPSGNPLFKFSPDATPLFQSSFLDVQLTMALHSLGAALQFSLNSLQRFIQSAAAQRLLEDPQNLSMVQYPKVSRAQLSSAISHLQGMNIPIVNESGGLEDLCDGSLLAARNLASALTTAEQMIDIYQRVAPQTLGTQAPPGQLQRALSNLINNR